MRALSFPPAGQQAHLTFFFAKYIHEMQFLSGTEGVTNSLECFLAELNCSSFCTVDLCCYVCIATNKSSWTNSGEPLLKRQGHSDRLDGQVSTRALYNYRLYVDFSG